MININFVTLSYSEGAGFSLQLRMTSQKSLIKQITNNHIINNSGKTGFPVFPSVHRFIFCPMSQSSKIPGTLSNGAMKTFPAALAPITLKHAVYDSGQLIFCFISHNTLDFLTVFKKKQGRNAHYSIFAGSSIVLIHI